MGYLDNTGLAYLWGKIKAKLVQPDWLQNDETAPDYVKNRPGGYDEYEVNITWDGDTTGKTVTASDENYFVKVSDSTPSKSKLLGGTLVYVDRQRAEEEVTTISIDESQIMELDGALLLNEAAVIVYNPPASLDSYSFTEAGVWFAGKEKLGTSDSIAFCSSLRSSANTPIKIPQKYLDLDGYAQEDDVILSTPQTLTEERKQQARENIGAGQLPVKVEILEAICENYESTQASNVLTFDTPITLDTDALYYLDYQYYNGTAHQANNSMQGFSRVKTDSSGLTRVIWLSGVSTNRLTLTANSLTDTWVGAYPKKAIVSIYKVQATVNDSITEVFEQHDAKGPNATASGAYSTAHGPNATASGDYSTAHGYGATASGTHSTAHGIAVIASGQHSHVLGRYNIEDTNNRFSIIIGNGNALNNRSNAHTLDWSGNAWFAGDVYVGSTSGKNKDEGSKKLATEDDLAAKADKPTTTEATLLASGWTGDSAPYTYTLSVTGVTADSHQEFLPALDITAEQLTALQAANIQDGGQAEGTVTLKAFGTKPTIDLPIRVLH